MTIFSPILLHRLGYQQPQRSYLIADIEPGAEEHSLFLYFSKTPTTICSTILSGLPHHHLSEAICACSANTCWRDIPFANVKRRGRGYLQRNFMRKIAKDFRTAGEFGLRVDFDHYRIRPLLCEYTSILPSSASRSVCSSPLLQGFLM